MKDYTHGKQYKNEKEAKAALAEGKLEIRDSSMWWSAKYKDDEESRLASVIDYAQKLRAQNLDREQANIRHARLYENVEVNSLTTPDYATNIVRQAILGAGIISLNVVQACIDTLAAKISKNKPRPDFQTTGASWKTQMKARKLNRWVQGFLYEVQAYENMKPVFVDGEVFGTGFLYVFPTDDDRLDVERVMPGEMFVDEGDALTGKPRQLWRRKLVQRELLAVLFPNNVSDIDAAPKTMTNTGDTGGTGSDVMVEVWEGWHLPSSKKAADGVHVIAVNGCLLLCEEWKIPYFPFVVLRSKPRVVGFHGKGTAESLTGIQLELNRLVRSVSEQLRRKGKGRIFLERGSKVVPAHMTNGIADLVYYTGTQPHVDNSNAVSQEEFAQIDRLYQRAFQEVGVSELSAMAKKPAGLDAGVALREYSDIESERFALKHQAWDNAFMDMVRIAIALIKTQYPEKLGKGYKVKLPSRRRAIEIDFKEVDLDEESYVMQMFPTSSLPQTPAARKQFVKELEADGMVSKTVAKRLLGFPDIEAEMDLGNAALDDVDATISAILDEPKPKLMPPEPYQNLELLLERTMANYLFVRHFEDIEPERLEMLRTLADMTSKMLEPPPQPAMPAGPGMPAPMPGAMPPGAPAPMVPPVGNVNISGPEVNMPATPAVPPLVA